MHTYINICIYLYTQSSHTHHTHTHTHTQHTHTPHTHTRLGERQHRHSFRSTQVVTAHRPQQVLYPQLIPHTHTHTRVGGGQHRRRGLRDTHVVTTHMPQHGIILTLHTTRTHLIPHAHTHQTRGTPIETRLARHPFFYQPRHMTWYSKWKSKAGTTRCCRLPTAR